MGELVLSRRKYKVGYEVRDELDTTYFETVSINGFLCLTIWGDNWRNHKGDIMLTSVKSAYTPDGHYIGAPKTACYLIVKRGIKPELIDPTHSVCSIGFCEKEQKWYGWSHRAIYGFGIGDVVKEGDCCASSGWTDEYLAEHPEDDTCLPIGFEAKDLIDAKRMAIAFAQSVS